jgi:hypothetical protein
MTEKARYEFQLGSGQRNSSRVNPGSIAHVTRINAEQLCKPNLKKLELHNRLSIVYMKIPEQPERCTYRRRVLVARR